jgi:hypothetical protein
MNDANPISFIAHRSYFLFHISLHPGTPNATLSPWGLLQLCGSLLEWHIHNQA